MSAAVITGAGGAIGSAVVRRLVAQAVVDGGCMAK
jgi:nucleoside-diphosphate-sugar epimerase